MKREEFIENCSRLTEEELAAKATEFRGGGKNPYITEEAQVLFTSLDSVTQVDEQYVETAFGKTHVYVVKEAEPKDSPLPVVINVHGGGWTMPHSDRDLFFAKRLAYRLHALVVDVDYVLAPEYPYPAALKEIEALFDVLPELLTKWGGDPANVVLCGQSAGGNLLGGVLQRGRFTAPLTIKGQVLCYLPTDNYNDHFHGEDLDPRGMRTEFYGFFYNRNFEDRKNSDVSILFATDAELRRLPPTDIATCELDNLQVEGEAYARRIAEAGVSVTHHLFKNCRHGFMVNLMDDWKAGEDYVVEMLGKYL